MRPEYYEAIIERLTKDYGLRVDREHACIAEFAEGPLPLFKLIMSQEDPNQPGVLIVSFHIELGSPAAIQWFLRIRQLDANLYITDCYLKDTQGESYVGQDAEILRMYMIEQDVIGAWVASNKDASEVLNQKLPIPGPSPVKTFNSYRQALVEFNKLQKKKGDVSH